MPDAMVAARASDAGRGTSQQVDVAALNGFGLDLGSGQMFELGIVLAQFEREFARLEGFAGLSGSAAAGGPRAMIGVERGSD